MSNTNITQKQEVNNIDKPSFWSVIPSTIRYDNELRANAKLLFGEISCLCNSYGYCNAKNQYFADLYNVSPRIIKTWIAQLVKRGYINVQIQDRYQRRIYMTPMIMGALPFIQSGKQGGGNKRSQGGDQKFPGVGTNVPDINNINNKKFNILKKLEKKLTVEESKRGKAILDKYKKLSEKMKMQKKTHRIIN